MTSNSQKMRRRSVLGALLAGAACGTRKNAAGWRFFREDEARTVEAICAQVIPADQDAGAREAGVVNYIDIQLSKHFRKHRQLYRSGIAAVDAASRERFGQVFADLPGDKQQEVLKGIEKSAAPFFDLIVAHTRQGFYGDPRHGGNRNMVGWKMLGLVYPQVRGRMHYGDDRKKV